MYQEKFVQKNLCDGKSYILYQIQVQKNTKERNDSMKTSTKITQLFCQHEFSKPVSFGFDNYDNHRAIQHLQQTCVKCGKVKPFSRKVEKVYKPSW